MLIINVIIQKNAWLNRAVSLCFLLGVSQSVAAQGTFDDLSASRGGISAYAAASDVPDQNLPPDGAYPMTKKFYTYTVWDSVKTEVTLTGKERFGDYLKRYQTETGILKIGDNEFGVNQDKQKKGAFLLTNLTPSMYFFYSEELKKFYVKENEVANAPAPIVLPEAWFTDIYAFNKTKKLGSIGKIAPTRLWLKMSGGIDSLRTFSANMDDDAEKERVVAFKMSGITPQNHVLWKVLICNQNEEKQWTVTSAIAVEDLKDLRYDAPSKTIVYTHMIYKLGTGQQRTEIRTELYRWQNGRLSDNKIDLKWEKTRDLDMGSTHEFHRHRFADFKATENGEIMVVDTMRLWGNGYPERKFIDTMRYMFVAEANRFEETYSSAWSRPPFDKKVQTNDFYFYTKWDSLKAHVTQTYKEEPFTKNVMFSYELESATYNIDGYDFPYNKDACLVMLQNKPHLNDDILASSCALHEWVDTLNASINAPQPIFIDKQFLDFACFSRNIDTLIATITPVKHWYDYEAIQAAPEVDELLSMKFWDLNIDDDDEKERIVYIWDARKTNSLMLIVDKMADGQWYIKSAVNTTWHTKLLDPFINTANKLIIINRPKGLFDAQDFYRFEDGQLYKVLTIDGGISNGGLRQELKTTYSIKEDDKIEVSYLYNIFSEQYAKNAENKVEQIQVNLLDNKEAKIDFVYDARKRAFAPTASSLKDLKGTGIQGVMGCFLKANENELRLLGESGTPQQKELIEAYLEVYLKKFAPANGNDMGMK